MFSSWAHWSRVIDYQRALSPWIPPCNCKLYTWRFDEIFGASVACGCVLMDGHVGGEMVGYLCVYYLFASCRHICVFSYVFACMSLYVLVDVWMTSHSLISDTVLSCQCNHVHDGFCGTFRRCLTWLVPLHLPLFCSMTIMTMHCFACRGTYCLACSFVGHMFLHCSKSVQNVHLHIKLKHRSREDPVLTCKKYMLIYK